MANDKERDNQAFWTVAIGIPVLLSVLRLWVEAGGELQTTLLLVEHIDPINLIAALVATASWLVSALFVGALAIGGVLNASGEPGRSRRLARWTAAAPTWVRLGSFALAAITWQLIYLPLLLLAAAAAFQLSPWNGRRWRGALISLGALTVYFGLLAQTIHDASRLASGQARTMALLLLIAPPILALFVAGPLRPWIVRPWAVVTQLIGAVLFVWVAVPIVTTPVLPSTVTVVRSDESGQGPDYLQGYVITSDEVNTVILSKQGAVTYVPNGRIEGVYLCPTDDEIPRYRLRLRVPLPQVEQVSLEHSVLRGLGQAKRGSVTPSPACRVPSG